MTKPPDLLAFLRARLAEDEAAAEAADIAQHDPRWKATNHLGGWTVRTERDNRPVARGQDVEGVLDGAAAAAHIARHDPARVLAEVAAKRAIVEEYSRARWGVGHDLIEYAVRHLAAVYGGHDDYREEWTP